MWATAAPRPRQRRRSLLLESRACCPVPSRTPERGRGRDGARAGSPCKQAGGQNRIGDISLFAHLKRTVAGDPPVDFKRGCASRQNYRLRRGQRNFVTPLVLYGPDPPTRSLGYRCGARWRRRRRRRRTVQCETTVVRTAAAAMYYCSSIFFGVEN